MPTLPRAGREWLTVPLTAAPPGPIQISFDAGATWHPTVRGTGDGDGAWADDPEGLSVRILVAGPDAPDNPAGTVVLTSTSVPRLRAVAAPEDIHRDARDRLVIPATSQAGI